MLPEKSYENNPYQYENTLNEENDKDFILTTNKIILDEDGELWVDEDSVILDDLEELYSNYNSEQNS